MRVSSFTVAFFMADVVVEAGVCKPARNVESSTALPATSTELLSTVTIEETSIATTATEADVTTAGEASTTTIEEASTITEEASTTTTEAGSSATPGSIVSTGPVAGQTMKGDGSRFVPLSFASSDSTQTLVFSLLSNGQLSTGGNNNYLCMSYRDVGVLGPLVLCPFDNFTNAPLKCSRASSGTLSCTAPNGSCTTAGTCQRPNNAALFFQFYVDNIGTGYFGPAGDFAGFTALDLTLTE
ncbi:uncharacterized protein FIESC28_02685 [Fusarium coffeatum]|uniref:Ubiquitin 3 binding protein But2 C-terminal domain-containing protein n=1 Tax=Fusarium coffeatum TaxID=231269 RepID=A0A366S5A7_9HYPO|nr:uncharacterized protein FIESC28_02685 [Fusarium coffeatum]RBR24489.1 hypothetical protein FIESC28_02685 [Fusarium coffeatum]